MITHTLTIPGVTTLVRAYNDKEKQSYWYFPGHKDVTLEPSLTRFVTWCKRQGFLAQNVDVPTLLLDVAPKDPPKKDCSLKKNPPISCAQSKVSKGRGMCEFPNVYLSGQRSK